MAAYIVARVDVMDWEAYREYMRHTPRVIQKFGGRFIARGGEMVTLEGPEETLRVVLIEFPSLEQAKAFYKSPEYAQTKRLRERGGEAQFVAVEGYSAEEWEKTARESANLELRI
ncbi:MAG: DUF1330 domain-containing protein [Acidobacteriota bacterium]|nr:DUF1330 domain-containing protein [Acidobacteriota bacterium]